MQRRAKGFTFPAVPTSAGRYLIPDAVAIADDQQLCVQLAAPPEPDFDGTASELAAKAKSYAAFHQSGVGQFTHRLVHECKRYFYQVDEAADRLKVELECTHRASLEEAIAVCEARLAAITPVEAKARKAQAGKDAGKDADKEAEVQK